MNRKGFTLVELLAVVAILGILSSLAIAGYTRYIGYSKQKAYKLMAKSVSIAAEEYVMDHPGAAFKTEKVSVGGGDKYVFPAGTRPIITFQNLIEDGYLKSAIDPENQGTNCKGYVSIGLVPKTGTGKLDQYIYSVDICCSRFQTHYNYTYQKKSGRTTISIEEEDKEAAYCPTEETPDTEEIIYVVATTTLKIGDTVPNGVEVYTSDHAATIASGRNIYLKHVVRNGLISESYVGFRPNGHDYLLQGGNGSSSYEANKTILKNLFNDSSECNEETSDGKELFCITRPTNQNMSPIEAVINDSGKVSVANLADINDPDSANAWCTIEANGTSQCTYT